VPSRMRAGEAGNYADCTVRRVARFDGAIAILLSRLRYVHAYLLCNSFSLDIEKMFHRQLYSKLSDMTTHAARHAPVMGILSLSSASTRDACGVSPCDFHSTPPCVFFLRVALAAEFQSVWLPAPGVTLRPLTERGEVMSGRDDCFIPSSFPRRSDRRPTSKLPPLK